MEDLGAININIRELGGGGGGAGNTGGGPSVAAQNAMGTASVPASLSRLQQSISGAMGRIAGVVTQSQRASQEVVTVTNAAFRSLQQGRGGTLGVASQVKGELVSFFRAPSVGGFAQLTQQGSATSTVLRGLGRTGAIVGKALMGVAIVGSAAALAVGGLMAASRHVESRIADLGKFSGPILAAQMEQRVQQLQDQLTEASQNGAIYARAIRMQTVETRANAFFNRQLGYATSGLSAVFSVLKAALYGFLGVVTFIMTIPSRLTGMLVGWASPFLESLWDTAVPGSALYGMKQILSYLGIITDHTKPRSEVDPNDINAWFQSDIAMMTGRRY